MTSWHGGKGSNRRKQKISQYESKLRWELIDPKTTPERKDKIKIELSKIIKLKSG